MIIVDLINDEAPLFFKAINHLVNSKAIGEEQVLFITEGNRWKECRKYNNENRLIYFDYLDTIDVDIQNEVNRISREYDNFNVFASDRYLIQKDRKIQLKFLVYTYLFYERIFSQSNVSHYFTTGIAYSYNLISYQVAKKYRVKHVSFYGTRIGTGSTYSLDVSNTFDRVDFWYKNYSKELVNPRMLERLNELRDKPPKPTYMKNAINSSSIKFVFIKEFFIRFRKFYFDKKHKYDLFTRNPFYLSYTRLRKISYASWIKLLKFSVFDKPDYNDNYFLFPLHMQPEASTLVLAPFHVDQKNTIINISKLLPPNFKLYVKEHSSALGQHTLSFYKELKKYPQIKLIAFDEETVELIKYSKGTINLSSTVGLESLIHKIPSIVLGDVFYNQSHLTFKVSNFDQLQVLINKILGEDLDLEKIYPDYDYKLAYFIHCMERASYNFEFNVAKLDTKERVLQEANVSGFAGCIKEIIDVEN